MKTYELKIGQTIFDVNNWEWGIVRKINGKEENAIISNEDIEIIYAPQNKGIATTLAKYAYPKVKGKKFQGKPICLEIDEVFDYPYYCPDKDENCYEIEVDF